MARGMTEMPPNWLRSTALPFCIYFEFMKCCLSANERFRYHLSGFNVSIVEKLDNFVWLCVDLLMH